MGLLDAATEAAAAAAAQKQQQDAEHAVKRKEAEQRSLDNLLRRLDLTLDTPAARIGAITVDRLRTGAGDIARHVSPFEEYKVGRWKVDDVVLLAGDFSHHEIKFTPEVMCVDCGAATVPKGSHGTVEYLFGISATYDLPKLAELIAGNHRCGRCEAKHQQTRCGSCGRSF